MADQPQESVQHPIPDRRNPQTQQSKFLGVDRRRAYPEVGVPSPGGDPNANAAGGEPETVPQDVARERERDKEREKDKGYN